MPVTIEEFNNLSGTNFSQESFNRGFLTIMSNVPKEKYNDTFTKLYLNALKTAISTHIGTHKNVDIIKCMNSFDDMFKGSIERYNEYAKNIDTILSLDENNSKTIKYLDNGGIDKFEIKKYVDAVIKSGPTTEQSEYKEKIKVSSFEDVIWGTKENKVVDDTIKLNKAAMRQVNSIFDGQPTVKMFEGKPNEIEVPINLDYVGQAPKTVNFGSSNQKDINYKNICETKEEKLHQSIQVVKAMEELHSEHEKSYNLSHPIKNANELKGISDLKNVIISKGYSKLEFDNEYKKDSPMPTYLKDYEENVAEYLKNKEIIKKEKQLDLTKSLEKETSAELTNVKEKTEMALNNVKNLDDPTVKK